ncbi:hypothetical protein [Tahibacter harae]|uniref:Anti-sigma-K factor RskA n=1 Tax=Tahibacter harae TaxID=2963937 RepID=A0ABT1QMY8_9GAMM|nr:hypothetical protein [Tahibacter harae]MCQ4163873.1 hypothetical protein [Tahibacter harae]
MNVSFPPQSERIRAYLDDQLDEDELEHFELELFSDPQLLDAVESERLLRQGLRDLDAELRERVQRLGPPPAVAAAAARRPPLPLLPMAAALLLGLIPAGLLWLHGNPAASVGNVHQAQLGQLRGAAVRLQLPPQADNLLLLIPQLAREGVDNYRVEIQGPGALRLERDKLVPGLDGQLSFSVPAAQLLAGDYSGRIIARRRDGGSETVGELNFQLEKLAAAR